MPAYEIFTMPLAAGSNFGDPDNNASAVAKDCFEQIQKHSGGKKIYFGTVVEKPEVFKAIISKSHNRHLSHTYQLLTTYPPSAWDSIQSHKDFMTTTEYPSFAKKFLSIKGGDHSIIHVDFKPSNDIHDKALTAPVTELATFLFPSAIPESYESGLLEFDAANVEAKIKGYQGAAYGFAHEDEVVLEDGKKGKAVVLAIGWDSVEDHLKFRETSTFKEHINLLTDGISGAEMVHVQFLEFVA
jgi:hypothetical protein